MAYHKHLDDNSVVDIIHKYMDGITQRELADEYGVDPKIISKIVNCKIYKHVEVSLPENYADIIKERSRRGGRK